jgi:hypothetical protein
MKGSLFLLADVCCFGLYEEDALSKILLHKQAPEQNSYLCVPPLEEKRLGFYDAMSTRAWFQAFFPFQMRKTLLDDRTRTH